MSRSDRVPGPVEARGLLDRLAHAFTPEQWTGRWLVLGIIVFAVVASMTIAQRALVAEGTTAWIVTGVHALVVVVVVPALTIRTVRAWRSAQTSSGVPE